MARRRRNSLNQRMVNGAKDTSGRLLADWAALTWSADSKKIGPLSISMLNWLTLAALIAAGWLLPDHRLTVLTITGVWLLTTIGRAATVMPARRKALQLIYDQNQRTAGLPRGSATQPANPSDRIKVREWGAKNRPMNLTLTIGDCPAATSVYARVLVEKSLASALGDAPAGKTWLFDWPSGTKVHVRAADTDSDEVGRQTYFNKVRAATAKLLRIKVSDSADYNVECSEWEGFETKAGTMLQVPRSITIVLGDFDYTDHSVRDAAERHLDKRLPSPGEWLYQWEDGQLSLMLVEKKSTQARRKRTTRKLNDDVGSLIRTTRGQERPQAEVVEWFEHENVAPDYPKLIKIDFGTLNLADRRVRDKFESDFDTAMSATYQQVTWLYDWQASGAATTLLTKAVSTKSKRAFRKYAERRLRNVVESKFGTSRNFVDCDILEWQPNQSAAGEALPQKARVNFGDYDVTKAETQDAFEQHWDSLTDESDWHYSWSPADGVVTIDAVPPLPHAAPFPEPGTDRFQELIASARKGKFILGPQKGGGDLEWDLNAVPHALIGGATGAGKSVTLSNALLYGMYNPDLIELYVCDPKRTDFTWTPEFPNVTQFAATDTEIVSAVAAAKQEMDRRQSLLGRVGVRNLRSLRDKFAENPDLVKEHGPAPRRLILFFDELAEFLAKSANKDIEELKDEARADLEAIGRLGRAMEVNILSAAQKPDAKIISTQLREQLGFRLCVGPVNIHTSQQILNSDHGTRFPSQGNPKGRAWAWDSKDGFRMAQGFYLPDESGPLPWDATTFATGAKEIVRERLRELGYAETTIINRDGGEEPRWVRVEDYAPADTDHFDDGMEETDAEPTAAPIVEGTVLHDDTPALTPVPTLVDTEETPVAPAAKQPAPQSPAQDTPRPQLVSVPNDEDDYDPFG